MNATVAPHHLVSTEGSRVERLSVTELHIGRPDFNLPWPFARKLVIHDAASRVEPVDSPAGYLLCLSSAMAYACFVVFLKYSSLKRQRRAAATWTSAGAASTHRLIDPVALGRPPREPPRLSARLSAAPRVTKLPVGRDLLPGARITERSSTSRKDMPGVPPARSPVESCLPPTASVVAPQPQRSFECCFREPLLDEAPSGQPSFQTTSSSRTILPPGGCSVLHSGGNPSERHGSSTQGHVLFPSVSCLCEDDDNTLHERSPTGISEMPFSVNGSSTGAAGVAESSGRWRRNGAFQREPLWRGRLRSFHVKASRNDVRWLVRSAGRPARFLNGLRGFGTTGGRGFGSNERRSRVCFGSNEIWKNTESPSSRSRERLRWRLGSGPPTSPLASSFAHVSEFPFSSSSQTPFAILLSPSSWGRHQSAVRTTSCTSVSPDDSSRPQMSVLPPTKSLPKKPVPSPWSERKLETFRGRRFSGISNYATDYAARTTRASLQQVDPDATRSMLVCCVTQQRNNCTPAEEQTTRIIGGAGQGLCAATTDASDFAAVLQTPSVGGSAMPAYELRSFSNDGCQFDDSNDHEGCPWGSESGPAIPYSDSLPPSLRQRCLASVECSTPAQRISSLTTAHNSSAHLYCSLNVSPAAALPTTPESSFGLAGHDASALTPSNARTCKTTQSLFCWGRSDDLPQLKCNPVSSRFPPPKPPPLPFYAQTPRWLPPKAPCYAPSAPCGRIIGCDTANAQVAVAVAQDAGCESLHEGSVVRRCTRSINSASNSSGACMDPVTLCRAARIGWASVGPEHSKAPCEVVADFDSCARDSLHNPSASVSSFVRTNPDTGEQLSGEAAVAGRRSPSSSPTRPAPCNHPRGSDQELFSSDEVQMAQVFGKIGLMVALLGPAIVGFAHFTGIERFEVPPWSAFLWIVCSGLVGTVLSNYLWGLSVVLLNPVVTTVGMNLQIPLVMFLDSLLVNEHRFSWKYIAGSLLVVTGVTAISIRTSLDELEIRHSSNRTTEAADSSLAALTRGRQKTAPTLSWYPVASGNSANN